MSGIRTFSFVVDGNGQLVHAGGNIEPMEALQIMQQIAIGYTVRRQLDERDRGTGSTDEAEPSADSSGAHNPEHTGGDRQDEKDTG